VESEAFLVSHRGKRSDGFAETQRFTAQRMKSTVVSLPVDHVPIASNPQAVADLIEQAAASLKIVVTVP